MRPLPGERNLKSSRLQFFQARLVGHNFNSPTWSKALIAGSEVEWRADGQHSATALANCDPSLFPQDLKVTLNTYQIDSVEEAPDLFDLFDNPIAARTNVEKIGVYVAEYAELAHTEHTFLVKVTRGFDYYYRDLLKEGPELQPVLLYVTREHGLYFREEAHRLFVHWLHVWRSSKHSWMIGKPGLVAEMFADWKNHPEPATRFWEEVMMESNPDPDDETREFSRKMKEWARKQPVVRQEKFRSQAKRIFDRYRRIMLKPAPTEESAVTEILPPAIYGQMDEGLRPQA